ncbi:MAG: thiamine pyrophosphate-requiring protein [Anaerolineae bacterium]
MGKSEPISGGQAVVEIFKLQGIEYIFSSPGTEWVPVWEALAKMKALEERGPQYVNCRHEELAVAMASGYSEMTGRLPAVLLHTTVGTLHGAMALREAYQKQVPMVVCAGDSVTFGEQKGLDPGFQWPRFLADIGGSARVAEPYVKWSGTVNSRATLPGMVYRAGQLAMSPPQGPVFLSIPLELMFEEVDPELIPEAFASPAPPRVDSEALEQAAHFLVQSQNPVIITENAGRSPEAVERLVQLAELLGAPVVECQSPMYLNFPRSHPLHAGYNAKSLLQEADVVFVVAAIGPWYPPSAGSPKAQVIVLDDNPTHEQLPYWGYKANLYLMGHVPSALSTLVERVKALTDRDREKKSLLKERLNRWKATHEQLRQAWVEEALESKGKNPIDPKWLCYALNEVLPENAIVVEETIVHMRFIRRYIERIQPQGFFRGASGGLGTGLGVALGLKWAAQDRLVVALMGDGAFNYNPVLPALGFAQEYQVPILIVIFNNQSYASMKGAHLQFYPDGWTARTGTFYGVDITPTPDYAGLMKLFDGYGERVEDAHEIQPTLLRAMEEVRNGKPALVDVVLQE